MTDEMTIPYNSGSDLNPSLEAPHPAVEAWSKMHPRQASAAKVVCLQTRDQQGCEVSSAFELPGYGPRGSDLVAKHCRRVDAEIEHRVYESILPRLGVPTLEYYGLAESEEPGSCWMFVAHANGECYSPQRSDHRILAGEWLGHFHTRGAEIACEACLPDRVNEPTEWYVSASQETLRVGVKNPSLAAEERDLLAELIRRLKFVEERRADMADVCRRVPRVLLHGDFLPHNIRVASRGGRPCLLPFDWALAGWGSPAIDLAQSPVPSDAFSANPDIAAYWSVVREHWLTVTFEDVSRLAHFATIFQCLSALHRDAPCLASAWPQESMRNMYYYRETLEQTFKALDWV